MLAYIWAEDLTGGIGVDGHLPWHLKADLKRFKEKTMNHPMIMGRRTFESLPGILPGRKHIVLTHSNLDTSDPNVKVVHSKEELDEWLATQDQNQLNVIIGGATLFKMYRDQVDILYQTIVKENFQTDTQMPAINYADFEKVEDQQFDDSNLKYEFITYRRK